MKPPLRGATHFAPAYPAACVITRLARVTLVLALIFAATMPSSAGDRRPVPRAVGTVVGWGNDFPNSPTELSGLSGAVAVAHGRHSLILKSDGTVLAMGPNDYGQLGDGTTTTTPVETPVQVSGLSDVVAIAVGDIHSIALKSDGTVWTWGGNLFGELGVVGGNSSIPVQVVGVGGHGFLTGVVAIAAGSEHSLALRSDGTVWAWGYNADNQLGVTGPDSFTPVQVTPLPGIVAITAGDLHSVALSSDGTVWAWGWNGEGELGMGQPGNGTVQYPYSTPTPQHVVDGMGGSFSGVMAISSYETHTLALKSDGTVWAWGTNQFGQLGNGSITPSATPVQALSGAMAVSAGTMFSLALKSDGTVWAWGNNQMGELGNGSREYPACGIPAAGCYHPTATQIPSFSGVVAISAGTYSSLALQSQAIGAAWGESFYGEVGDGFPGDPVYSPRQVSGISGLAAIASGDTYNLARLSDGSLWTWGNNPYGLGNGTTSSTTPVRLASFAGTVAAIATGGSHSLVLKSDGTVWAWGFDFGTTPELQSGFSGTVALAGGVTHSLALRNDGTVWARGRNTYGQLGTGNTTTSYTPVQVIDSSDSSGNLTGVVAVAAGGDYSLALKSDGTVWSWGMNNYGQLGIGSSDNDPHSTPVQVSGLSGVAAIAAGYEHGLALKSDGTVWVWGHNDHHQLGNGSTTDSPTPRQVSGFLTVAAIATSCVAAHTLALKGDGTLWGWGLNNAGQLGFGVTGSTPTQLDGPSQLNGPWATSAIAAGDEHSLTMALSLTPPPTLTVTAYDQVMTYGGTVPTLTYDSDVTPLDTEPTCITSANSTSPVGTYTITCSGAALAGYEVTYVPGTLTVNPAPLAIIADNKWMYPGSTVPLLTASYVGLAGGDTAQELNGLVTLTTSATSTSPAGTYDITFTNVPTLANYTVTTIPGTLTVNPEPLPSFSVLYSFKGVGGDGGGPNAGLVMDSAGNLYGTTYQGGFNGYGTVFELVNSSGTYTEQVLYRFTNSGGDGAQPAAGLVMDSAGNLYGTTYQGGFNGYGTVFELVKSSGTYIEQVLYRFTGSDGDGVWPVAGLVMDSAGNLYGTTYYGGSVGWGTVFELVKSPGTYTEQVLYSFTDSGGDGASPQAGLVMDSAGNLYGTTMEGGLSPNPNCSDPYGCGTVFELSPISSGTYTEQVLYRFTGSDGDGTSPWAGLTMDSAGNLYGTTMEGGLSPNPNCSDPHGCGTVFELSPTSSGTYTETVLYSFRGSGGDGAGPRADLVMDSAGNLYGTTTGGGSNEYGTVFELVNSPGTYTETVLHSFTNSGGDGAWPKAGLVMDSAGNLYGPTYPGGSNGYGTVFELFNSSGTYTSSLTVTASNQVMTYGGTVPTLTYSSNVTTLDTTPTCVTSAGSTSPVATYTITCSGAVKAGYEIAYIPGTLTVNPAPLTIIADNKAMGAGSRVPPLTASYFGFVNGDTAGTAFSSPPTLTLPTGFNGTVPGTYTITVGPVTAPNYSIVSQNGQLTVNANALNLFNNFFVTGDYAVGSTSLRSGTGTITVATPTAGAIPQGAGVLAAFLYWQTVESATSAPASGIQFLGYRVLGAQQLGSDIGFTDGTLTGVLRTYRANVLPYLPVTPQGLSGTPVAVSTPADWANGSRHAIGASLVVVYRLLSNETDLGGNDVVPLKAVVLYDGSWVPPGATGTMSQDLRGFYEAAPGSVGTATAIVNTGSGWAQQNTLNLSLSGDHVALASGNVAAGGVMVLSTPVNAGSDGLLASWKTAHGYQDPRDGSWVDLPDVTTVQPPAQLPEDLFVQIDYMCSLVNADGTCDTVNGHSHLPKLEALEEVALAFENHGINVHFDVGNNYQDQPYPHIVPAQFAKGGNIIPEQTCTDTDPANPQCVVPNEPGVLGWKLGLGLAKMGPRDANACATTGDCSPRFQHGRKDSYHYALFAHSIATPAWSFAYGNLVSISINSSGDTATITTSAPHGLGDPLSGGAPARITIAESISQPYLNGIYVPTVLTDTTFTISVKNVAGPINSTTDPALAIYSGKKGSSSGYSDVGGADTVITLGNWKFCLDANNRVTNVCPADTPQDDSLRVNVQAGTLMHELGHSLGLTHGGTYYETSGTYLATYEANCKPNYQSVMNYLFQIDLLGPSHNVLDYSGQALGPISEVLGGDTSGWGTPNYSTTSWYSPYPFSAGNGDSTQSAATRHCDGTPIASNETMYRWDAAASSFAWSASQDVNFDGQHDDVMQGYDDWSTYNLRQIGATGSHFVSGGVLLPNGGGIVLPNGGGIVLPNGGGVLLPDGSVVLPNGSGVLLPNGGGLQLPNGGGVLLTGGGVLLPNGGGVLLPNGGGVLLPDGTVVATGGAGVQLPNGGGVLLPNGGGVQLANGGIILPNGGGVLLPNGGGVLLANGGGVLLPNGGGVQLPNGGGVLLPNGGGVQLPNGGGILLPNGGGVLLPGDTVVAVPTGESGVQLPNGGGILLPNGGGVQLPNGGGIILANGGGVLLPNGGGVLLPNGGGVQLPNGGGVLLPNGGGVLLPNGGGVHLPNGGGILLPNGGGIQLANGGGLQLPNGGGVLLPNGGGILLPNGGGVLLANGGGITLPNGGGVSLPNGGGVLLPNGGGILFPNGGGVLFPNGGGEEMDYETANSFVRPPYGLTKTQTDSGIRLDWQAPNFGVISQYTVYDTHGNRVCSAVGNPPATSCDVAHGSIGGAYLATATIPGDNGAPRESQPSELAKYQTTITFGEPSPPISASNGSAFPVSVTSDNTSVTVSLTASGGVCTIAGTAQAATVTMTASSGICTLTATQNGDASHAASSASRQVQATTGVTPPALVLSANSPLTYMQSEALSTSGGSDSGAVTYSVGGACSLSGNVLTANSGTGSCTVTARKGADVEYSGTEASATVSLAKAAQSITFTGAPTSAAYKAGFTVATTTNASTTAVITANGSCSIAGTAVTMTSGTGACSLTATWVADSNYASATASQSTTASKIAPTVTFTGAPQSAAYQAGFTVATTTNASTTGAITSSGACSNTGNTVTMTSGTGACSLTATWAADSNYTSATASQSTTASKAAQTITFPIIPPQNGPGTVTLAASASSGLTVSYSVTSGPATVSGNTLTTVGAGSITVQATQAGNANYTAATPVSGTFTVSANAGGLKGSNCNGAYTGTYNGNLTVSTGQTCTFTNGGITGNLTQNGGTVALKNNSFVNGNLQMNGGSLTVSNSTIGSNLQMNGGSLTVSNSTIGGNLQIAGASSFSIGAGVSVAGNVLIQNLPASAGTNQVCGASVRGNLTYQSSGAAVQIGSQTGCAGNTVIGNLTVQNNTAATTVDNNTVGGNLIDQKNTAVTLVFNNRVTHNLQCQGNTSINGGGNTAVSKQGQCVAY